MVIVRFNSTNLLQLIFGYKCSGAVREVFGMKNHLQYEREGR